MIEKKLCRSEEAVTVNYVTHVQLLNNYTTEFTQAPLLFN